MKAWYEIKLQEARSEAQQDAQYLLQGDVCFQGMMQPFREFLHFFCFVCELLIQLNFMEFCFLLHKFRSS